MSSTIGKHIHHALCGHGGERVIRDSEGNEVCKVDGYEPETKTVFQYHGCKWHSCPCQKERDEIRYENTLEMDEWIKERGYRM